MHGHLVSEPKGFWADVWSQVLRRPGAVAGLVFVGIISLLAVIAPFIANGHPYIMMTLNEAGETVSVSSPLFNHLSPVDVALFIGGVAISVVLFLPLGGKRSTRMLACFYLSIQAGLTIFLAERIAMAAARTDAADWLRAIEQSNWFIPAASAAVATLWAVVFIFVPLAERKFIRAALVAAVAIVSGLIVATWWMPPPSVFDYRDREAAGEIRAIYAPIPFSPHQRRLDLDLLEPGQTRLDSEKFVTQHGKDVPAGPMYVLGTDGQGQDVLSQLIHACRLSISIGLVSTGIAVIIGVTMGALMGYFGGWVDLLLYRVVEIFMAIPVLFLLIVAAAVLPRNVYVMMAIIGCVAWTSAARFTRAEFYRLRGQDFVQAARALGLPLRSILFKHMLPNGVTPVLVDTSFSVAAAILFEAVLSFLLLGPTDQPSWGRLLAGAFSDVGDFAWWIAIFPGFAIFLTVLSLTLVGEALRDAIDPKLKKAAH